MTDYRLKNEGEKQPTGIVGTPLGRTAARPLTAATPPGTPTAVPPVPPVVVIEGRDCRPENDNPFIDYTKPRPTVPPAHKGVLAAYIDKHGNRFGVDVYSLTRSWAKIRIVHAPAAFRLLIGTTRQVQPHRVVAIELGDVFWWHWPTFADYDYATRLRNLKTKVGVE